MSKETQPRKKSSVRHTRAIQQNRHKHPVAMPSDQQIKERIQEIVHPATLGQVSYFHRLGLRERTLGLVVMVAFVLEMIWRQIGGVSDPKAHDQRLWPEILAVLKAGSLLN